jgi:hypothetical protein
MSRGAGIDGSLVLSHAMGPNVTIDGSTWWQSVAIDVGVNVAGGERWPSARRTWRSVAGVAPSGQGCLSGRDAIKASAGRLAPTGRGAVDAAGDARSGDGSRLAIKSGVWTDRDRESRDQIRYPDSHAGLCRYVWVYCSVPSRCYRKPVPLGLHLALCNAISPWHTLSAQKAIQYGNVWLRTGQQR